MILLAGGLVTLGCLIPITIACVAKAMSSGTPPHQARAAGQQPAGAAKTAAYGQRQPKMMGPHGAASPNTSQMRPLQQPGYPVNGAQQPGYPVNAAQQI